MVVVNTTTLTCSFRAKLRFFETYLVFVSPWEWSRATLVYYV